MTELSNEVRDLIARGKELDAPDEERRDRVKRALFATLAGGGATLSVSAQAATHAAGAAGAVKGIMSASLATWFALGVATGAAAGVVPAVVISRNERSVPREVVTESPKPAKASSDGVSPSVPKGAAPPPPPAVVEAVAAAPRSRDSGGMRPKAVNLGAVAPSIPAESSRSGASSFSEETQVLQDAQKALATGHAELAIQRLREHGERFPKGALSEEREAALVLALCALGRDGEARRKRDALALRAPNSPLLPRLDRSCAATAE